MSRWPRGIDAAYLKHEGEERMKRVLAIRVAYGCFADQILPESIVDRDPGDEDDGAAKEAK